MLVGSLSTASGLRVIATGPALVSRGGQNWAEVAHRLRVATILTGSLTGRGSQVTLNLNLIDERGQQLWSGTYQLASEGALEASSRVCRDVMRGMRLREADAANRPPPVASPKAQRAYLIGRFLWNKRDAESLRKSVNQFQEAIAADPAYAPAHAALADAYAVMAFNDQAAPQDVVPKARESAERALTLEPRLAEAHAVLAWIDFFYDWTWDDAETEFRRAMELNPNYATAHQWYGLSLVARGRFDEAACEFRAAVEIDPLSLIARTDIAVAQYYARRYSPALHEARAAVDLDPSFFWGHSVIGAIETEQDKFPEAITELSRAYQLGDNDPDCAMRLAVAYVRAGKRDRYEPLLAQLIAASRETHRLSCQVACVYAALGDRRRAMEWLQRAYGNREAGLAFLDVDPLMDSLRADPGFAALRRSLHAAR